MTALTPTETNPCRASSADQQASQLVFMDVFRGHPDLIEDWGTAVTPAARAATLRLFEAVAQGYRPGLEKALASGASPVARLNDVLERQHHGKAPAPPLRSPLDLAWWRQTHNSEGWAIYGNTRDGGPVRDLGLVAPLLAAGALPDAQWLRRLRGESWEIEGNPSFEAQERAVLDRIATSGPWPEGVTLVPAHRSDSMVVASAVPRVPNRAAHLWLHRAIGAGHWGAFNGWFDRGGAVGTLTSDHAVAMLWDATLHLTPPTAGPYVDQDAVHAAIARVRGPLLHATDALYRKEVLGLMAHLARPLAAFEALPTMSRACHRGLDWLVDLIDARPLASFVLTGEEQRGIGRDDVPFVETLGIVVERRVLAQAAGGTPANPTTGVTRPRL